MRTSYTIDLENRIIGVDGLWDDFAVKNDGAKAMASKVIGRSLWDFVAGFEVQSFLNAVIFTVRQKNLEFYSLYRCDSPDTPRLLRMTATPILYGQVRVDHAILELPQIALLQNVRSLSHRLCANRCSLCCSFKVGDEWVDPFAYPETKFFPNSHNVCPTCKVNAQKGLNDSSGKLNSRNNWIFRATAA